MSYEVMTFNESPEGAPENLYYFSTDSRTELYAKLMMQNPECYLVTVKGFNVTAEVADQLRYIKRQMANKAAKGV
jgi:hypothetical protein